MWCGAVPQRTCVVQILHRREDFVILSTAENMQALRRARLPFSREHSLCHPLISRELRPTRRDRMRAQRARSGGDPLKSDFHLLDLFVFIHCLAALLFQQSLAMLRSLLCIFERSAQLEDLFLEKRSLVLEPLLGWNVGW